IRLSLSHPPIRFSAVWAPLRPFPPLPFSVAPHRRRGPGRSARRSRMSWIGRSRSVVAVAVVAAVATLGPAGPARSVSGPRSTWIVQLADPPLASYEGGGVAALAATSPRVTGRRLDPAAPAVRAYGALLDHTEQRVLAAARAGRAPVLHRYRRAFAGFSARLTAAEATALARTAGVAAVSPDTVSHPLAAGPLGPV